MDHNKAEMGYFGLEYAGFWVFPLGRTKPYADNCDFMNARHHTFLGEIMMCTAELEHDVSEQTRPWPADRVERWPIEKLIPYANRSSSTGAASG